MDDKEYLNIVRHYEACLDKFGDTHQGVDWPKAEDAEKRYKVMLDVIRPGEKQPVSLLDFGCGTSHLFDFIQRSNIAGIHYAGLDVSPKFISVCRQKHPDNSYFCMDIFSGHSQLPVFDYVVLNGVFTEKCSLSFENMLQYFRQMVKIVFEHAKYGIAFNTMSKQVDWEREELFHLPLDTLAWFLKNELSRHFIIRNDYGLYEYTTYVYKEPVF